MWPFLLLAVLATGAGALNNWLVPRLSNYVPGNKFFASYWGQSLVTGAIVLASVGGAAWALGMVWRKPRVPGLS